LCFIVQFMVTNRYVGFVISFLLAFMLRLLFSQMHLENPLYIFNSSGPMIQYSDMNGYGHTTPIFILFKLYWLAVIGVLFFFGLRFYLRGKEKGLKTRFKFSRADWTKSLKISGLLSTLLFLGLGAFIFYNVSVLNKIESSKDREKLSANFEKTYKHFENTKQPRIVSSYVEADLYPMQLGADLKGY
jgi:ABC-2 type transport system permease protein